MSYEGMGESKMTVVAQIAAAGLKVVVAINDKFKSCLATTYAVTAQQHRNLAMSPHLTCHPSTG